MDETGKSLSDTINGLRRDIREKNPLVHCITNPISINQVANTILAAGARPMCAEYPIEAVAVTASAGALMLNLGNLTGVRAEAMRLSAKEAHSRGIRFVLDVCGAACLENRREYALELIRDYKPQIIKGNYSEIKALVNKDYSSSGVDADGSLEIKEIISAAGTLAAKYGAVVLASGKEDVVTNGKDTLLIGNGTPQLSAITGTGCMQGALCAAFLTVSDGLEAAAAAAVMLGICGELSETDKGSGSFQVNLLDNLSTVKDENIEKLINIRLVNS